MVSVVKIGVVIIVIIIDFGVNQSILIVLSLVLTKIIDVINVTTIGKDINVIDNMIMKLLLISTLLLPLVLPLLKSIELALWLLLVILFSLLWLLLLWLWCLD